MNLPANLSYTFLLILFFNGVNAISHSHISSTMSDTVYDTADIIADGATLKLISKQFAFTEGPAPDKHGNVFFTDQPNDKIYKYSTEGELTIFLDKAGRSNGLYVDKKENLLACADENNQLWSIGKNKKVKVLVDNYDGRKLNGPNDLWVDKKGGIYFTDPYYQRPYWSRQKAEIPGQHVYYLSKKKQLRVVSEGFKKPNGIVGSKDGKRLYVADIGDDKTYMFDVQKDGSLSNQKLFAAQGSDGMTIDDKGNVYLTGNGITVYNSSGQKIKHIPVPARWTANVCFGGKHKNQLFITASENLFTLQMNVKGIQ